MRWEDGRWHDPEKDNRMANAYPDGYVIHRLGSKTYAECCFDGGDDYEDFTTDEEAVIQNAIDACEARRLRFKTGTYEVNLTVPHAMSMFGEQNYGTILKRKAAGSPILNIEKLLVDGSITHLHMGDLLLDGNNTTGHGIGMEDFQSGNHRLYCASFNHMRFRNYLNTYHGFHLRNFDTVELNHCIFEEAHNMLFLESSGYPSGALDLNHCLFWLNGTGYTDSILVDVIPQNVANSGIRRVNFDDCVFGIEDFTNTGVVGLRLSFANASYVTRHVALKSCAFESLSKALYYAWLEDGVIHDCDFWTRVNPVPASDRFLYMAEGVEGVRVAHSSFYSMQTGLTAIEDDNTTYPPNTIEKNNNFMNITLCLKHTAGATTALPTIPILNFTDQADANATRSNLGRYNTLSLANNLDVVAYFNFRVPQHFHQIKHAYLVVCCPSAGNLRWGIEAHGGKGGEVYAAWNDAIAANNIALVANTFKLVDCATALDGIAASDLVGLKFTRHGTHGDDTLEDVLHLVEMYVEYV